MDISKVRLKFQKPWNFDVLTNINADLSQACYSLQQESLNSDDMLLYVTSTDKLPIEGHVIEAEGQRWIVYLSMKEVVNEDLYQYRLYPVTGEILLRELALSKNDLGMIQLEDGADDLIMNCYLEEYSTKERSKTQVVESYQQFFIVAGEELPDYRGTYELYYKGIKFKIDSFEKAAGIIKIRATEDL